LPAAGAHPPGQDPKQETTMATGEKLLDAVDRVLELLEPEEGNRSCAAIRRKILDVELAELLDALNNLRIWADAHEAHLADGPRRYETLS